MALKRKRSSPALSSPTSDSDATTQSSPLPCFYQHSKPVDPLMYKPTWFLLPQRDDSQRHLNSRTRKRHRDNRPDEQQIYGMSRCLGAVIQMSVFADVFNGSQHDKPVIRRAKATPRCFTLTITGR